MSWQVPSSWVKSKAWWVRSLVWAGTLGPGFFTRNLYAGFWLLPGIAFLANQPLLAVAIGGVHGAARACGIIFNVDHPESATRPATWSPFKSYRAIDGFMLLIVFGGLLGASL